MRLCNCTSIYEIDEALNETPLPAMVHPPLVAEDAQTTTNSALRVSLMDKEAFLIALL